MTQTKFTDSPAFSRILPFAVYMVFIILFDLLKPLIPEGVLLDNFIAITYPVKILAVTGILVHYWKSYDELRFDKLKVVHVLVALLTGIVVFVLWINMDWNFATFGSSEAYDPGILPGKTYYAFLAVRLAGTALVVPLFEEIFWRSFVLRYIINQDFIAVKIGAFTWMSFIIASLLFGSEHYLWLAGIMAGVFYNLLLYWSRNIYVCIIAHSVTNLLLGIYVIRTGNWQFW
ncbi:MAG TPA: CAAX prenyl protease-related protein [Nitrospirae bacterium]|nr:CAAX amino terminal protease self- immunity [bacterium BMS3Bbin09]HDN95373.1 CAAX prenyl protease-related protein [Nitrospirota bacterium]HDO66577.1 CAAX prenyl protease-related protein [Nitrospirota bacterium]HEW80751.1 CAAX prenyl protease-related protein [Nitrospirota bacterium]